MARIVLVTHIDGGSAAFNKSQLKEGDHIVGVDGGTAVLFDHGITPHVAIGDFDSISAQAFEALKGAGTTVFTHPAAKDESDLELALAYAMNRSEAEIVVFSRAAGRADHTYANVMLLTSARYATKKLQVWDGDFVWSVLRGGESLTYNGLRGALLSLIPIEEVVQGVSVEGARWPLSATTLQRGTTRCVSNEITAESASVRVDKGVLLVAVRPPDSREWSIDHQRG